MTVGSLFSGIGGFDLGLERAGMEPRWQVEIDGFCRKVLAKHWPAVERYSDIRELDGSELEHVDLVCGGFPCQPVSYAGKRLAQDDPRWLWPEFSRIIRVVRPRFALLENVPGLLSRGMGDVLGDLAEIGYDAEWQVISAAAVGAPHGRARLWIVAYPDSFTESQVDPQVHSVRTRRKSRENAGRILGNALPILDWEVHRPAIVGVDDGLPDRVDRLRALGNAVVPQVVEYIGRRIIEAASC